MSMAGDPTRILIIKPSSLGDVTHTLPVLGLLRRRYPSAHIAWMVAPACAGLIESHPALNEIILFDRHRFGAAWRNPAAAIDLLRLHRDLLEHRFDMVIDLQGLFRSGWLCRQTRAPIRIGFASAREGAWMFYTHQVPIGTMDQHAVDRYLQLARTAACDTTPIEFEFAVSEGDRRHVDTLVAPGTRYAVLMPGANWLTKRWPAERFGALVEPLRERFGLASVVAGGKDAAELASAIPGAVNLSCRTNLKQLVALLERAELVIANDSGPMHIAAALGRPLVAIFGPTNPIRTGPYQRMDSVVRANLDCMPCYKRKCKQSSCLRQLGIEPVLATATDQIAKYANRL